MAGTKLGRVVQFEQGLRWRVVFPDSEHLAASGFLRDVAASDCSVATLRSYAYDLLRWFRFLHGRWTAWERAERTDVRELVEQLRETPVPQRLNRRPDGPPPGSVNPVTGKAVLGTKYAARTINHQLSVLFGFYEWACAADLGPLMNPVPAQRTRSAGRLNAHHNPMDNFVVHRRATYRQKVPRPAWRAIPDDAADALFSVLRSHRDRALVSFWLSSGARATELLGLCLDTDLDAGANTITVVSKGSRLRETIPASVDSFVWLALYLREECPPVSPGGPLWWTRQGTPRPLTYHAARAVLHRANAALGTNWTLHDLRHTAAARLLADPAFTLFDVQTILRHASVSTTQIYAQPRLEDLVAKVLEHYARPRATEPSIEPVYDSAAVRELLGLPA
ncbi:tyrosine-type recombinase/integrase [Kribbella sp. NBC_00889]|uniref:tyrosine-type recombinase/integrase n=1 Tax=Kribbella sp. NBC_00889 TaxID=2975974 RepID=UPI00386C5CDE|nr:tyrosine-type recombinase/integrase [Kribbella sp. NBC_00889]